MTDLEKVIKGLECCSLEPERLKDCRYRGCPYSDLEGKGEFENFDCVAALSRDALSLVKEQESELIRLREKAENVVLKSSVNMQRFKYRLEDASDDEASDYIREHLKSDLIRACEKMGLIAYEESRTNVGGSAPMVSITATLRVHKPEVMKQDG